MHSLLFKIQFPINRYFLTKHEYNFLLYFQMQFQFINRLAPSELCHIQNLNKYRLQLTQRYANKNLDLDSLKKISMELQIYIYQNMFAFDLRQLHQNNLQNILAILSQKKITDIQENTFDCFDANWDDQDNISQQQQTKKTCTGESPHHGSIQVKNLWVPQKQNSAKIGISSSNKYFNFQKKPISNQNQKIKQNAQFVSAGSLPKAVSVRKKFVPPFIKKNQQLKTLKQQENQDEQSKDLKYKGLEEKLVKIIQSEILQNKKVVKWSQIAGLSFAKKLINQMIVWPMLRPDIFKGLRAPPRGILLFGPPGTGKTMIGRAIASEASATFFNISASSLTSKWVGESQKLVRTLFQVARIKQPSVIFIDQIDSLLCSRSQGEQESSRRVKTQFLVQLDGAKNNQNERILIIGATNLPQQLDDAVRRRFVKRLYIPLPNEQGRVQLFTSLTSNQTFSLNSQQIRQLAHLTKGFSGADIHALCQEASMIPLRQITQIQTIRFSQVPATRFKHFFEAMKFVRPSVNKKVLSKYQDWNQNYGSYQFNSEQLEKTPQNVSNE